MMLYDHEALYERNLLVGFSRVIWLAVSLNALGGIAVSMALKCVDPPCIAAPAAPAAPAAHAASAAPAAPSAPSTPAAPSAPRYADNIQKTFAVGISIVLNCLVRGRSKGLCTPLASSGV